MLKSRNSGDFRLIRAFIPGVYTWGAGEMSGNAGPAAVDSSSPMQVPFFAKRRVQAAVSGEFHVVVISGGEIFSWGNNAFGQLGRESAIVKAGMQDSKASSSSRSQGPLPVGFQAELVLTKAQLVAGGRHTFLLTHQWKTLGEDDRVEVSKLWAWGHNKFGQCGVGVSDDIIQLPRRVLFHLPQKERTSLYSLHAGMRHSIARTSKGDVYIWGHPQFVSPSVDVSFTSNSTEITYAILSPTSLKEILPHLSNQRFSGVNIVSSPSSFDVTFLDVCRNDVIDYAASEDSSKSEQVAKPVSICPEVFDLNSSKQNPKTPFKTIPVLGSPIRSVAIDTSKMWKQGESKDSMFLNSIVLNIDGTSVPLFLEENSSPSSTVVARLPSTVMARAAIPPGGDTPKSIVGTGGALASADPMFNSSSIRDVTSLIQSLKKESNRRMF